MTNTTHGKRRLSGAETRRGLRLWELRKRRCGLVARLYLTPERDASRLFALHREARRLEAEINTLAGENAEVAKNA
ncbi:MAG: hypothetical protein LBK99_10625 [Opitutaceae bacterium]|jgi:hypothetical protein|nr:hypothetical protein [Opitutaceae bacterium]